MGHTATLRPLADWSDADFDAVVDDVDRHLDIVAAFHATPEDRLDDVVRARLERMFAVDGTPARVPAVTKGRNHGDKHQAFAYRAIRAVHVARSNPAGS